MTSDERSNLGPAVEFLASCVEPKLEDLQAAGALSSRDFSRLSQAFGYWKFADEFTKALDTAFFDEDDESHVYLSILARGTASPGRLETLPTVEIDQNNVDDRGQCEKV